MVGPEPTGLGGTHPSHNITMAPAVSTPADNSTESEGPVNKNDVFEEIKSKFLNEIDKIPCKSCRDVLQSQKINRVSFYWRCFMDLDGGQIVRPLDIWPNLPSFWTTVEAQCNKGQLKRIVFSKMRICREFTHFIRTDLEKDSIASLAHRWILYSEWVPSEWVQTSDKNITIIHITSVRRLTSCEMKTQVFYP